jgi:phosphatidyl-myo-inositol alpha-mannosyltransferase
MRVALVSPYSYTYPGGVGRHVEGLAAELLREGHEVRVLAPYDPDDARARFFHRGARPEVRPLPPYAVSLGRTIGLPANGAVSNVALTATAFATLLRELRSWDHDVVHVHEPNVGVVSWATVEHARGPLVGTFHTYSTNRLTNGLAAGPAGARRLYNKLHVRLAVSEAARWTAQRFYGGRYRIVPNGVDLSRAPSGPKARDGRLRILFVGRAEARKGLPVALRAYEALRAAGIDAVLTVAGATPEETEPLLLDASDVDVRGRVSEEEKWRLLHEADVLCAPSLGGESFGIVLAEAFAAGTPVVCSDIAGYRDVVRDGLDGVLVPAGDPAMLAQTLRDLALEPERLDELSAAALAGAERFSWPHVTERVLGAYEDAAATCAAAEARRRAAREAGRAGELRARVALAAERAGIVPADGDPPAPPRRLASLEPAAPDGVRRRTARALRRGATVAGALAGVGLAALALQRIGVEPLADALLAATPVWVLVALALMGASMLMRAEAWHSILRAALPGTRVRRRDIARGTMIGVLMSATMPARLGEPSRAFIVARRLGRVRERLPVVLGTLVSQTILNIVALCVLGGVMFATVGLFKGNEDKLVIATIAPIALLLLVVAAPSLLRRGRSSRSARVRQAIAAARGALVSVRRGLHVFRNPRLGAWAAIAQLSAWAVQWLACYVLLVALGLDERAGLGAAAAVLFAVNVTAVLPVTPSNVGVFQAACIAVLSAYGVGHTDAFAYGIILQAVEVATAVAMGMPALVREGMTWRDMRLRALHAAPVELGAAPAREPVEAEA